MQDLLSRGIGLGGLARPSLRGHFERFDRAGVVATDHRIELVRAARVAVQRRTDALSLRRRSPVRSGRHGAAVVVNPRATD